MDGQGDMRIPLFEYLKVGKRPNNKNEARKLTYRANRFAMIDGALYKKGYNQPFLKCLNEGEAEYVLSEIHEGICRNHSGGKSLAHKTIRQGYYHPAMKKDVLDKTQVR